MVDQWGIPVLRFHWKWSEHETKQAAHMQKTFAEIIEAMGGTVVGNRWRPTARGRSRRAARSSTKWAPPAWAPSAKTSVLNQWCQSWDVKNLFVTDGAPFVSNADKNPTLSILALAWRDLPTGSSKS